MFILEATIHSHLYLKSGLGHGFWPGFCLPRPKILSANIDLPCFMTPEWFLAIYAFYRLKKYQIGPILWQFIPKIRAGAGFWPGFCLPRPKILSANIDLPCFMTPEWFLAKSLFAELSWLSKVTLGLPDWSSQDIFLFPGQPEIGPEKF